MSVTSFHYFQGNNFEWSASHFHHQRKDILLNKYKNIISYTVEEPLLSSKAS